MYNLVGHQCNGASRRFNGHYQGRGRGSAPIPVQLMSGGIYQSSYNFANSPYCFLGEEGQPFKLGYRAGSNNRSQFNETYWGNDTNIAVMIIPHAVLKFTDHFNLDIADLANRPFTCPYNVTLENTTFTVTTMAGSTPFTFDALVVKIPKSDMLEYRAGSAAYPRIYHYLPNFDITFTGISYAIEMGADKEYSTAQKVYVGKQIQQPPTYMPDFICTNISPFATSTHYDISDYQINELSGSIGMGEFGDRQIGIVMFSPFQIQSMKIMNGGAYGQYINFQSKFSNTSGSGISDNGINGYIQIVETGIFSYMSKYENNEFEITSQKQWRDYFKIGVITTSSSAIASSNIWSW